MDEGNFDAVALFIFQATTFLDSWSLPKFHFEMIYLATFSLEKADRNNPFREIFNVTLSVGVRMSMPSSKLICSFRKTSGATICRFFN